MSETKADDPVTELRRIMARLRDPETGCPWDVEQDFASIAPYTIEEAYEVADAITRDDMAELREELGDLLLQVVFHSQMASEAGHFTLDDVARSINDKMIRRHPHVFASAEERDAAAQTVAWEAQKAAERAEKGQATSHLDGVALALPALLRALKLQKRAARAGFDWAETAPIYDKLQEEVGELKEAEASGNADAIEDELGDLLFVSANLARRLSVDPEAALRRANAKFERRFRRMEEIAASRGLDFDALSLDAQEALWQTAKSEEIVG